MGELIVLAFLLGLAVSGAAVLAFAVSDVLFWIDGIRSRKWIAKQHRMRADGRLARIRSRDLHATARRVNG